MAKVATRVVTAHVPTSLADKMDRLAGQLDRPRGWIVKQALSAWITQQEERDLLTREALADVDAGRVVDHETIQAWAEGLTAFDTLPANKP